MLALILGVVNEFDVARATPPVNAANQLTVPALGVALKETVPVPQRDPGTVAVIVGNAVTVAVTAVLGVDIQPALLAAT